MRSTISRAIGMVVLCGALFAVAASPAAAAQSHPFLFSIYKFTPEPNVTEHFEGPCGLAVDKDGAVYAADYYHDKVDVFSSGGGFLTQLKEVEELDGPCGLAVGASGRLFADVFHRNVTGFTPAAFPIASKTAYGPGAAIDTEHSTGVAVDPTSGNVYIDDRTYIAVYEPSGVPVEVGGQPLRIGLGSLGDAYGVAVSAYPGTAGFVYVPDAADNTIKVYDPATDTESPLTAIGGQGTPQGEFKTLRDAAVAIDRTSGHLFVSYNAQGPFYEHPRAAVAEFNSAGEYRGTLPAPTPLWFGEPSGIAVDNSATASAGRVYVTSGNSEFESAAVKPEKPEEGAVYAFGPSAPGQRLQVSLSGAGSGTLKSQPAGISCPGACAAEYDEGAQVKLTPTAAPGSVFAGWSGDCAGGGACTVAMSSAKTVVAQFEVAPVPAATGGGGPTGAVVNANGVAGFSGTASVTQADSQPQAAGPASRRHRVRHGHRAHLRHHPHSRHRRRR